MNGICSCLGYLTPYCFMDSIIKTLECILNILLNIGTASFNLLPIGYGEHNIAMFGKGVGFLYDTPRGCQDLILGVVRVKQGKDSSHAHFKQSYGNLRESLPVVVP